MPSVTVHLQLAERVLDALRRSPGRAPLSLPDGGAVNAFRQGAFGPDLGYIPGGHRPLSDLAHCLRSGDRTRTLLRRARAPTERAFAWGWLTHVLADTPIHPLVGCAVGELDAGYEERYPELRVTPLRPVFGPAKIAFLVEAFRETYRAAPAAHLFLRSHLNAARRVGLGLAAWTARILPTDRREPLRTGDEPPGGLVSWLRSTLGRRNLALGYVLPALAHAPT